MLLFRTSFELLVTIILAYRLYSVRKNMFFQKNDGHANASGQKGISSFSCVVLCLIQSHALPFSSLPKYVVHFSLRASLPSFTELFLHLLEQNHKIDPSFLTYIIPVPCGKSLPQNEHFLGLGKNISSKHFWVTIIF
jgi:hypothetical protein